MHLAHYLIDTESLYANDKNASFSIYTLSGRKLNATFDPKQMAVLSQEHIANGVYLLLKQYTDGRKELIKFVIKR
jgi:hypothetical protein